MSLSQGSVQIQFPRPIHNTRETLIVVPIFPASDPRARLATAKGGPGMYRAIFELCVPGEGVFRKHVALGSIGEGGDSLLRLPLGQKSVCVSVKTQCAENCDITLSINSEGRIASVGLDVHGRSLRDAERQAYDTTAQLLSTLSFLYEVAIDVSAYAIVEAATGTIAGTAGMIGREQTYDGRKLIPSELDSQSRRLLAAYREGLNATNPFYQALTFCKVFEGCQHLREQKTVRAKQAGITPSFDQPRLPLRWEDIPGVTGLTKDSFAPFLGKKFAAIVELHRHVIRDAVAHLDPRQLILDMDRHADLENCRKALPLFAYMAARWISAELASPT